MQLKVPDVKKLSESQQCVQRTVYVQNDIVFIVTKIVSGKHIIHIALYLFAYLEEAGQEKDFAALDISDAFEEHCHEALPG